MLVYCLIVCSLMLCCRPQAVGLQRVCQGAVEQFVEMKFEGPLMRELQRRQINQSVWQVGACLFHILGKEKVFDSRRSWRVFDEGRFAEACLRMCFTPCVILRAC